jgi:putative membrane protein
MTTTTTRSLGSTLRRRFALVGALVIGVAAAGVTAVGAAASSPVGTPTSIADHETVQVVADSSGNVTASRLLNQLEVVGDGHFVVVEKTATDGLRNLNGFSLPKVSDGNVFWDLTVHGKSQRRTVANLPEDKLPLTVRASYTLDGKPIAAKDIVGKSGLLKATYVVSNVSATPEVITYRDGRGHLRHAVADVVMPIVGQLMTTLPASFRDVQAEFGTLAADGRGGTITSWQLVMFPPLGQASQTLTYSAQLDDASLPEVTVQAIPVAPNATRGTRYGEARIKAGAHAARQATQGGVQLDGGLVQLADGAGQLLDGLNQLYAGAAELTSGLADQAAPGARKLADGIGSASAGGADLASGLGKLSDGTRQLSDGTSAAANGSTALVAGLKQISSGLGLLANAGSGLPAALSAAQQMQVGITALVAGLGDAATSGTVLNGLAQLSGGLSQASTGLAGLASPTAGLPAAKAGVDQVATGLSGAASTSIPQLQTGLTQAQGLVTTLLGQVLNVTQLGELNALATALGQVNTGLGQLLTATQGAVVALQTVSTGLGAAVAGVGQLQTGVGQLQAGAAQLISGVTQVKLGLASGNQAAPGIAEGLGQLVFGLTSAVGGVSSLNTGMGTQALPGAQSLDAALHQIASGAGELATGQHDAHVGAKQLSGGLGQLLTGGRDLADGLGDAAAGAGKLTKGLKQAKAGPKQLAGGLDEMREQGAQTLIESGNANAVKYGKEYGVLQALDAKAAHGGLLYDPPEGASGAAAYSYTLAAASHQSSDNAKRGAGAVALLVLTCFLGTLLRRRVI